MASVVQMLMLAGNKTTTAIAQGTGTAIGDMTSGGNLAASFDGTTSQTAAASSNKATSTAGYTNSVGKDWGASATKIISRFQVYGPNNQPIRGDGAAGFKLQGSTDNFSGSTVDLYSSTTVGGSAEVINVISGITMTTPYRYHRITINGNGANSVAIAEIVFYEDI